MIKTEKMIDTKRWAFMPFTVFFIPLEAGEYYEIPGHDLPSPLRLDHLATFVFGGVGMVHGPDYSLPVEPGYDFAHGVSGMAFNKVEAITPLTYMCVSKRTTKTHKENDMYKILTGQTTDPFTTSAADGLSLCVISGEAYVGEELVRAGKRIDLTDAVVTVTPTGAELFQYFFIKMKQ